MLIAPGPERLRLEHEKLLSNFAFKSNPRRYNEAALRGLLNLSILADNQAGCSFTTGTPPTRR
jgi:hypothetical protein